jgi:hypothetical protein
LTKRQREVAAVAVHQKSVSAGVAHLIDVMALVQPEDEEPPTGSDVQLQWVKEKIMMVRSKLEEEDVEFMPLINKVAFAQQHAAAERALAGEDGDPFRKPQKKPGELKRQGKDKGGDVQTRVLDRTAVKQQAKAMVLAQTAAQKKKEAPPK